MFYSVWSFRCFVSNPLEVVSFLYFYDAFYAEHTHTSPRSQFALIFYPVSVARSLCRFLCTFLPLVR